MIADMISMEYVHKRIRPIVNSKAHYGDTDKS